MLGKTFMALSIILGMAHEHYDINNWVVVIGIIILFVISIIDADLD